MFLMSIVYVWYLVGPIALLGCFTILLFYPLMVIFKDIALIQELISSGGIFEFQSMN